MKILVVIDMQNDFINGALGTKEAEAIVAEAKAQAAQMKAEMTKSAREGAMGAEEDAKAQSEQMMQAAGAEEGKDLEALQKAVAEKQQKAVEVILSELL